LQQVTAMTARLCTFIKGNGQRCRADPMTDSAYCFWHAPEHAAEVSEAGRLGGLRAKREHTVAGAFQFDGVQSVPAIRRLVEVAIIDTLSLENSLSRNRTLAYLAMVALKLLEVGELEDRVATLEAAVHGQPGYADAIIDAVAAADEVEFEPIVTEPATPEDGQAASDDTGEGEA
jgi:hypothetical protein